MVCSFGLFISILFFEVIRFLWLCGYGNWPYDYGHSLTSSLSLSMKQTVIQSPVRGCPRPWFHHLLGYLTFQIKLLFLASTPRLIIGQSCGESTNRGFGNISVWEKSLHCTKEIKVLHKVYVLLLAPTIRLLSAQSPWESALGIMTSCLNSSESHFQPLGSSDKTNYMTSFSISERRPGCLCRSLLPLAHWRYGRWRDLPANGSCLNDHN